MTALNFLRNSLALKWLTLLLVAQVFNCSVDPPDRETESGREDLNFNDMESVVEILLEKVLGIDNAIPEHDEPDSQPGGLVWKLAIDPSFVPGTCIATCWNATAEQRVGAPVSEEWEGCYRSEPVAPPPKA